MEEPLEIARYTPKERQDYEDSLKVYRDVRKAVQRAVQKAMRRVSLLWLAL